jgi:hypothetical protein
MNLKVKLVLLMALTVLLVLDLSGSIKGSQSNKIEYGRIIGHIVDEETYEPVREKFLVYLYSEEDTSYADITREDNMICTDNNGNFSVMWKPGEYYLYAITESESSRHCDDPHPLYYTGNLTFVKVNKGEVTRIGKEAHLAGQIKIILVDPKGAKIIPKNIFGEYVYIQDKMENSFIEDSFDNYDRWIGDLIEGEMIKPMLYPEKYHLELYFKWMGYGSVKVENIQVERNKTVQVKVAVDLNDKTGVEGCVSDQFNFPLQSVEVELLQRHPDIKNGHRQQASIYTDQNGYYRIIGLKDDFYTVRFSMQSINGCIEQEKENLYIAENRITRLDKVFELKKH